MADYSFHFRGAPSKKSDDGGFGGFGGLLAPVKLLENLGTDVYETATGLPAGVYHLATTDPRETLPAVLKGMYQTWKPLVEGHPIAFAEQTFEHPLAPILDVAALFTGGATLAGKTAIKLADAGVVAEGSRTARLAKYASEPGKMVYSDVPGRTGRLKTVEAAKAGPRRDIIGQTQIGVAQRARQEFVHSFAQKVGGLFAQTPYEAKFARDFGEGVVAAQSTLGYYHNLVERVFDTHSGIAKTNMVRKMGKAYTKNDELHAFQSGNLVPLEEYIAGATKGGIYDPRLYGVMAKDERIFRDRAAIDHTTGEVMKTGNGRIVKRKFGSGSIDDVQHDFGRLMGRRIIDHNPEHMRIMTGGEFMKRHGLDLRSGLNPTQKYVALLHKPSRYALGESVGAGMNMAQKFFQKGTFAWKTILLAGSPFRYGFNNFFGNGVLTAMNHPSAILGMREAWRQIHGADGVKELDRELEHIYQTGEMGNWFRKYHGPQAGQGLYHSAGVTSSGKLRASHYEKVMQGGEAFAGKTRTSRALKRYSSGVFGFVGRYAETSYRAMIAQKVYLKDPRVQKAMEDIRKSDPGMASEAVIDKAIDRVARRNPDLVSYVDKQVEDTMGNYFSLMGPERTTRRYVSPFYTWQRHILRAGTKMALDRPGRTAIAAQIGQDGWDISEEWLGENVPDWMKSYIPGLDLPGLNKGDVPRTPLINTQGMNPFSQLGEEGNALRAALGVVSGSPDAPTLGETFGGLLNPGLQAGIQGLTNTNMLTGAPISSRDALLSPLTNLPQYQFLQRGVAPTEYKQPTLFSKTPEETFYSWLGIPAKEAYLTRARQLGIEQARKEARG